MPCQIEKGENLISCIKHIDMNRDMLCDSCESMLDIKNYMEEKTLATVADDNSIVKVSGNMPENTVLETATITKEEATNMAQKYLHSVKTEDVLYAYDISILSETSEYEPGDYNQVVMVNISNLDLNTNNQVALLHIIDEDNYEIIPFSSINDNEIAFKTTRFSAYIIIEIEATTVILSGDGTSEITLTWGCQDGVKYNLYYTNEDGSFETLAENVTSPYTHSNLENNKSYEYTVIGYDETTGEEVSMGSVVGYTNYEDVTDIINKDSTKPVLGNIIVSPSGETVGQNDEVTLTFDVTDDNYDYLNGSLLYPDDIEVLIEGLEATTVIKSLEKQEIASGERFILSVTNIWGDGALSIKIPAGSIKDLALNGIDEYVINTGITASKSIVKPVSYFSASSGDSENSITIKWEDNNNDDGMKYVLEVSKGDSTWLSLKETTATTYTHGELTKNMSFEYRIKVVDSYGNESDYVYATGRTEYDPIYGDVMIDTVNPSITLTEKNPNVEYIGATQEITLTFESYDENYNADLTNLTKESFIIKVDGVEIEDVVRSMTKTKIAKGEKFELTLTNLTGLGTLTIGIPEGVIIDSALNPNLADEIDTGIMVVNGDTITKTAPTLVPDVHTITVTTNQISTFPEQKILYEYRLSGDGEFIKWKETTERTVTIEGLYSDTDYEVRTTITDVAGNSITSDSSFTTTLKIDASAISIDHETKEWTNLVEPNPKVTATVTWNDTKYTHEYSLDNTSWTVATGEKTEINITKNLIVYARYSDGVGHSDPVEYEIKNIDLIKPQIGNVEIPTGKANSKIVKVSGITDEGGSNIKGYFVNTEANLDSAVWETLSSDSFEFVTEENAKHYIWVIDNAGNISAAAEANVTDIVDKVSNIEVPAEIEVEVFETVTPELTYDGEAKDITWEIEDESIATIDPDTGEITGIASGETTVKVTIENYDGTKEEIEIKVTVTAVTPDLEVEDPEFTFVYGGNSSETEITYSGSGEITVESEDENIATVEKEGNKVIITPGNAGETTVTVTAGETPEYAEVEVTIKVVVSKRPVNLSWSEDTFTYDRTQKEITADITNKVGQDEVNVNEYNNNQKTDAGNYTAVAISLSGAASNNYTLEGGTNLEKAWVINKADRNLTLTPDSLDLEFGANGTITFNYDGDAANVTATSSNTNVVTVTDPENNTSGQITVTPVSAGTAEITVSVEGNNNYNADEKTITVKVGLAGSEILTDKSSTTIIYNDVEEIGYEYTGNGAISVAVSDESILEVVHNSGDQTLTIIPKKASDNEVTITITASKTEQYEAIETEITVKVDPRSVILEWTGDTFEYDGDTKEVTASITNIVGTENVDLTYSENTAINAGNYTAEVVGLTGEHAHNYTLKDGENLTHDWIITKTNLEPAPTVSMENYVYGGKKPTPIVEGNIEGGTETFYVYSTDIANKINWLEVTSSTYLAPGTYKMYAEIGTTTNYEAAQTNTVEFTVTLEDIEVTLTENGESYDNNWTNNNVVATVTVPESILNLGTVNYRVSGNDTLQEYETTSSNGNVVTITFNQNFNEEIYFVAVDAAGKEITSESGPYVIKIDKEKPEIGNVNVVPGVSETSNTKTINVSNITDEGGSGIYGYYVGPNLTNAVWTTLSEDNFTYKVLENGTYNIYVKDVAGNISDITEGVTGLEIKAIVDEITNATLEQNLEVEVYKTIMPVLSYSGEAKEIIYEIEDETVATVDSTGKITGENVGETKVKVTIKNYDSDIEDIVLETTVKVTPRMVTITWTGDKTYVYDGTTKSVTATVTNAKEGDTVTLTIEENSKTEVGNYIAKVTGVSHSNYTLDGVTNLTYEWSIIPDVLEPTITMNDYVYGGEKPTPEVLGNLGGGTETIYVYSEDIANKINWNNVTSSIYLAPGTYKMYAEIGATNNYEAATTPEIEFKVSILDITVELTENSITYDNEWTNNDIVAEITVPVEVTTMGSVYYRVNDDETLLNIADTTKNGNVVTINFTENINGEIYFVAVNKEGKPITNESTANVIKIDKTAPEIGTVKVNPAVTEKSNTKVIEVSNITDEGGSGIAAYYVGTETDVEKLTWTELNTDNFTYEVFENKTYNIFVKDAAGNVSDLDEGLTKVEITNIVDKVSNIDAPGEVTVEVFDTVTPELTFSGDAKDITWEIEDENVAIIDPDTGEITGVASGETTVKVTIENYDGTKEEIEIKVTVTAVTPDLEVEEPEFTFVYGGNSSETEITYSGSGEITAKSEDENIATVEKEGNKVIITPGDAGETIVTITAGETPEYEEVQVTIKVVVSKRPVNLSWSTNTFTYDGTAKQITAEITNKVGTDEVNVSTYNNNQKTDAGNYTAVATSLSGADANNYTLEGGTNLEKAWVINKADRNLTLTPDSLDLKFGENGTITFSYDGDAANVTATSSNTNIVTVTDPENNTSGQITVTPGAKGTAEITVSVATSSNYNADTKTLTVNVSVADASIIIPNSNITLDYGGSAGSVEYEYVGNALASSLTVSVENSSIAEAEILGNQVVVTPKDAGETKIIISAPATEQYGAVSGEITVKVNKRAVNLTWLGKTFEYNGDPKQVTASIDNLVTGDIVNITYTGNVQTNAGNYTAEAIELTGEDANNYTLEGGTNLTHDWSITKTERIVEIETSVEVEYGKNGEVKFKYNGEDVEATVKSGNENVARAEIEDGENEGTITIIPVGKGETTVTITIPGSQNYEEKVIEVTVKVNATEPELELSGNSVSFVYGDVGKEIEYTVPTGITVEVTSQDGNIATAYVSGSEIVIEPKNVGTTTLTVTTKETNQYISTSKEITVTVAERPVILDWGEKVFNYDGTLKTITATVSNIVPGDTVVVEEYTGNQATEVGTYTATAKKLSNDNYTLDGGTNISTEWTIERLTPPEIIVRQGETIIPSGTWASGDVTVEIQTLNISGINVTYEYSYNGLDWFEYTGVFNYTTETTSQMIYARSYNKQNGIATSTIGEYNLKLDKTDPDIKRESVTATGSINNVINKNSEVTITINIEDLISGIADGEFEVNDIHLVTTYEGQTYEILDVTKSLLSEAENLGKENGTYEYTLTLKNIKENGRLALRFDEKTVNDRATRYNKLKTISLGLTADNKGPEIGIIKTSADEYGRVFGNQVSLEVTATDDSGIKSYEWQVSTDGVTWETFETDETSAEISDVIYDAIDDGVHHFRVIVTDIMGNKSISDIASVNMNITMNRKPTIRFETEQVSATRVKITAIVKSTRQIVSLKVNSSEIDSSRWNVTKTNNELTLKAEYIATANGTYNWTAVDEIGNSVTEKINITTIDDEAAVITYETFDATEYSNAKIEFTSNQEIRISKVIKPNGETTNIITGKEISEMTFTTVNFARKVTVRLEEFEIGTTFVFENKSFIETYVVVDKYIETKLTYVRVVSAGTKLFNELFEDGLDEEKAEMLVNQMAAKTRLINGRITSYYGISNSGIIFKVSEEDELTAVGYLAGATNNGDTYKINEYGDIGDLIAEIKRSEVEDNSTYTNGNITGIKVFGNILNWTGNAEKNTFRITITE